MVYLINRNTKLSAKGPSSSCEETQKPTICSCVGLPFLCLLNNGHRRRHWALGRCPALCCLLSVSSNWALVRGSIISRVYTASCWRSILAVRKSTEASPQRGPLHHKKQQVDISFHRPEQEGKPSHQTSGAQWAVPEDIYLSACCYFLRRPLPSRSLQREEKKNKIIYIRYTYDRWGLPW